MAENEKTIIAEFKTILGKVQVPTEDYTILQPSLIIGGINTAKDTDVLRRLGVTHIINCAYDPTGKGNFIYVDTNEDYYAKRGYKCEYLGVRAADTYRFNLAKFFYNVADFIENCQKSNGVAYVHCYMAISRSAALVIAYYIIKHKMSTKEAVTFLRAKREIFPNEGFLKQLLELEKDVNKSTIETLTEVSTGTVTEADSSTEPDSSIELSPSAIARVMATTLPQDYIEMGMMYQKKNKYKKLTENLEK